MSKMRYEFKLATDVRVDIPGSIFANGPWEHLATILYNTKEFIIYRHVIKNESYIEEVDLQSPGYTKAIENDELWKDLYEFAKEIKVFSAGHDDMKIAVPTLK
jgi:hypothetical protein